MPINIVFPKGTPVAPGKTFSVRPIAKAFSAEFLAEIEGTVEASVKSFKALEVANRKPEPSDLEALRELTRYVTKEEKISYGIQVTLADTELFGIPVPLRPIWFSLPLK